MAKRRGRRPERLAGPGTLGKDGSAKRSTRGRDMDDDAYMSTHSIADATSQLPCLIDRALNGESVVISRDGQPVVELRPLPAMPRPVTQADIDWLDAHRVGQTQAGLDAATEVRRMRDEGV